MESDRWGFYSLLFCASSSFPLRCTCGSVLRPARWRSNLVSKPARLVSNCSLCVRVCAFWCSILTSTSHSPLSRFTSSTCAPRTPNTPGSSDWCARETSLTASRAASTPGALSKLPPHRHTHRNAHRYVKCTRCHVSFCQSDDDDVFA